RIARRRRDRDPRRRQTDRGGCRRGREPARRPRPRGGDGRGRARAGAARPHLARDRRPPRGVADRGGRDPLSFGGRGRRPGYPPGMSPERRCPNCGALVSEDAEWCGQCFTNLREPSPAPPVPAPAVAETTPAADPAGESAAAATTPELKEPT